MKPAEAARAAGMSEDDLREVNHIPARMVIKSGSTLVVPRNGAVVADVSSTVADNATMVLAPDAPALRKVSLRAGTHDSVDSIAHRYRVSASQVAQWNDVGTGARFAPGQTIVVYMAPKAHKGAAPASTRIATNEHGTRVAHSKHRKGAQPAAAAGKTTKSAGAQKHVEVAHN
jgi:membrane-bound lytic murein transglycosylase D